jgi:hypothetical protein
MPRCRLEAKPSSKLNRGRCNPNDEGFVRALEPSAFGFSVSCVAHVGGAFFRRVLSEDGCACVGESVVSSGFALSQQSLELGEHLFDRIEVGRVFRQEHEARPDGSDGLSHRLSLVGAEIVEDDDVARLEGWREELFDIGAEAFAVDGSVEQAGRINPIAAQSGEECRGLPAAMRDLVHEPLALRRPASKAGHVRLRPGLVDENQALGIDEPLIGSPARTMASYVRAILLLRDEGLFLNVTPIRRKKRLIIEVSALTPRSDKRRSQSA